VADASPASFHVEVLSTIIVDFRFLKTTLDFPVNTAIFDLPVSKSATQIRKTLISLP
jgi:hypothetical protein